MKKVKGFKPGSHGCHEALHMASFLVDAIDKELCEHPSITANKDWLALAVRSRNALDSLYQLIGKKHIPK